MNCFSDLWTVKLGDWGRGLVVAILTTPLTIMLQSLSTTPITLVFDWKTIGGTALAGGIAYILKNLVTGSGGDILKNAPKLVMFFLLLPALLFGSMTLQGCPAPAVLPSGEVAQPWYVAYKTWTTDQRADFFMQMWMAQEADFKTMNLQPNKSAGLVKAMNTKREVLEQSRVPLRTYVTLIKGGGIPDAATEKQLVDMLTQLQLNYLQGGK
jgi:hypothetical protein